MNTEGSCQAPPWEAAPFGVVSLLEMLEFAARDFLDLSYNVGVMLGALRRFGQQPNDLGRAIGQSMSGLPEKCKRLDLPVTGGLLGDFMVESLSGMSDSEKAEVLRNLKVTGDLRINNVKFSAERMVQHIETIYRGLRIELSSLLLRVIPREKGAYISEEWLADTVLFAKFPDTVVEFHRAGRCYAYGENTACVFHLMRVVDFLLGEVAGKLMIPYDPRTWSAVGQYITKQMEQKYQTKTDDWK